MYEDLEPRISRDDLKAKIDELTEVIKESRDYINDQQNENDTLKKLYNETYNDAARFTKHITDLYKIIQENDLDDLFKDLEVPE